MAGFTARVGIARYRDEEELGLATACMDCLDKLIAANFALSRPDHTMLMQEHQARVNDLEIAQGAYTIARASLTVYRNSRPASN